MAKLLWTQKQDIGPHPRVGHAMVFDAARQRVLLFGGDALGGQLLKDTWHWDGSDWTQLEDIGPSARARHAMTFDAARGRTVLFGGTAGTSDLGDTWEWDGEAWTQIQDTGPSPRSGHAMAFDVARGRVVLFGGGPAAGAPQSDTWEWDGQDWSQQENVGPSARRGHAMTYDSARSRTVLFGGLGATSPDALADTWEWDGTLWTQVADIGPDGCLDGALVFKSSVSALFGGISTLANVPGRKLFGLTWEWNGQHWTARQDIGVGPRVGHAMAFDSARGRVVLFGGLGVPYDDAAAAAGLKGDTWEHPDVATGPGGPGGGTGPVDVESVSAQPDVISGVDPAPTTLTIDVVLQAPAPAGGAAVAIETNVGPFGTLSVSPHSTFGSLSIDLPGNLSSLLPVPFTLEITADGGGVTQSTTVEIT